MELHKDHYIYGDKILVLPHKEKEKKTKSGLETAKRNNSTSREVITGDIVVVGESLKEDVSVGDTAYFPNYLTGVVNIGGVEYISMRIGDANLIKKKK
jgi:co-chaperonin GroES (HSP10)